MKKIHKGYTFLPDVHVRVVNFPFEVFSQIKDDNYYGSLKEMQEALILSSSDLIADLNLSSSKNSKKHMVEKTQIGGYKYISRAVFKTVPFGLFCGVGICHWGDLTKITINKRRRKSNFDSKFLNDNVLRLLKDFPILNKYLKFHANNTITEYDNKISYYTKDHEGLFDKAEVKKTTVLLKVIRFLNSEKYLSEITVFLVGLGYNEEIATEYLDDLITAGIILNSLELPTLKSNYLTHIIRCLDNSSTKDDETMRKLKFNFQKSFSLLSELDVNYNNHLSIYEKFKESLSTFFSLNGKNIYSVTSLVDFEKNQINQNIKQNIMDGLIAFSKLIPNEDHDKQRRLNRFIFNYRRKFGEKAVPITIVLNDLEEFGYGGEFSNTTSDPVFSMNLNHRFINKKLNSSIKENSTSIILTDEDINSLETLQEDLCPMICVKYSISKEFPSIVQINSVSNNSGINLINRFSTDDSQIDNVANKLAQIEKELFDDVILMEVNHIPLSRAVNVISSNLKSEYVFNYYANPADTIGSKQIDIKDIYVCITEGNIVLFSGKYGRELLPRFYNSLDPSQFQIPLIKFLFDLQNPRMSYSQKFEWKDFIVDRYAYDFLPRIIYKNAIISPAYWHVSSTNVLGFDNYQEFIQYIHNSEIPKNIILVTEKGELLLNLQSQVCFSILRKEAQKKQYLIFKEFLNGGVNLTVSDQLGNNYNSEYLAFLYGKSPYIGNKTTSITVQRNRLRDVKYYSAFDQWVFYKIYHPENLIDNLLITVVRKIAKSLFGSKIIKRFFFVRYKDPHFHLRLRFQFENELLLSEFILIFNKEMRRSRIKNFVIENYEPDVFGHGLIPIELTHEIYFNDSETAIVLLKEMDKLGHLGQIDSKLIYGMQSIEHYFQDFGIHSIEEKYKIVNALALKFHKEFDTTFSKSKKFYENYLNLSDTSGYKYITIILNKRSRKNIFVIKSTYQGVFPDSYLITLIHLSLNRIFDTNHRWNEMIVYSLLSIDYKRRISKLANYK